MMFLIQTQYFLQLGSISKKSLVVKTRFLFFQEVDIKRKMLGSNHSRKLNYSSKNQYTHYIAFLFGHIYMLLSKIDT